MTHKCQPNTQIDPCQHQAPSLSPPTHHSIEFTTTTTTSQPPSSQIPPPTPTNFPYTFTQIIGADHRSLNRLAGHATNATIPLSSRLTTLKTLIWRLIRHDISEDLVMRPAFTKYLGASGATAAARDRDDHAALRGRLVDLFQRVNGAVRRGEGEGGGEVVDEEAVMGEVKGLAGEMAAHMREESGVVLPRFEGVVSHDVSLRLGWEYARTLVLTPGVEVYGDGHGDRERRGCFIGVMEYLIAEMDVFEGILGRLKEQAGQGTDGGYLGRRVREEMGEIGLSVGVGIEGMRDRKESKVKL